MQWDKREFLHWLPRILAVFGIVFLSMFALDVFSENERVGEIAVALFMHLVPAYFIIAATVIAWRWRFIGGILFLALSIASVLFFKTYDHIISFILLSLPLFIVGWLFIWDGMVEEPADLASERENA